LETGENSEVVFFYRKGARGNAGFKQRRTQGIDFFWDVQFPFQNKYATTVGFSIGRSFYFGDR
jgi:hypothetical protein